MGRIEKTTSILGSNLKDCWEQNYDTGSNMVDKNKSDFGENSRSILYAIYSTWFEFVTKRHGLNTVDIVDILWNSLNIIYNIFRVCPKVEHLEKNRIWPNRYSWINTGSADQMLLKQLDLNKIQNVLGQSSEITENFSNSELWFLAENEINFE